MTPGPKRGTSAGVDFAAKAQAGWGVVPDWVAVLAEACTLSTLAAVATRLTYSSPVVSQVLSNSYRGDLGRVEQMVRGALMGSVVACPVLGEISRDRCLDEQKRPFSGASAMRAQLFQACRSGCPNARLKGDES